MGSKDREDGEQIAEQGGGGDRNNGGTDHVYSDHPLESRTQRSTRRLIVMRFPRRPVEALVSVSFGMMILRK